MSETFIKIDSLQHLKISRQTHPTNRSKICVITFTIFIDMFPPEWARGPHNLAPPVTLALPLGIERGI